MRYAAQAARPDVHAATLPGWRRGRDGMPRAAVRAGAVLEAEPGDLSMKAAAGA